MGAAQALWGAYDVKTPYRKPRIVVLLRAEIIRWNMPDANRRYELRSFLVTVAVNMALANAVFAQNAAESFQTLFGDQVRKVTATASPDDDLRLAVEIVGAARENKLPADLQVVMYNHAFDLASRSEKGHDVALDAMDRLAAAAPGEKIKCSQKALTLHHKRLLRARKSAEKKALAEPYARALIRTSKLLADSGNLDSALTYSRKALSTAISFKLPDAAEIRSHNSRLTALRSAAKKRKALETRLAGDPSDAEARRKLIELHLIELNDPVAAGKLLNSDCDEGLRTYAALAAKPADQLETGILSELGRWYIQLGDDAPVLSKAAMYRRAEGYYDRYLELYTEKDTKRLGASLALASIRKKLARLGLKAGPAGGSGRWPGDSRGLVLAWRDSTSSVRMTPRGKAQIASDKSMSVAGGSFLAPGAVNAKLLSDCMKSNALTIEAMIKPDSLSQAGPARIISFSQDGMVRNFTVGQEKSALVLRLRTASSSDQNTTMPLFKMSEGKWHHVVVTYHLEKSSSSGRIRGRITAYLNGKPAGSYEKSGSGKLSGWASMHLLFGDEFADKRDWAGRLKNIAVYSRAITAKEAAAKAKALGMLAPAK